MGSRAVPLRRDELIGYRYAAHDLAVPAARLADAAALGTGVQDTPPGSVAHLALRARVRPPVDVDGAVDAGSLVLVHSVRATMHVHRATDMAGYAAALRPDAAAELSPMTHGQFFAEIATDGIPPGEAFDQVAVAMRAVMADGEARTKGELSTAVTPRVDPRLAPWCGGCGVHHVQDALFRYATLQAGLVLTRRTPARFREGPPLDPVPDRTAARHGIVREYLRLAGAATHSHLAGWLGLSPAGARGWWRREDLVEVSVDGMRGFTHAEDLAVLRNVSPPRGVVMLAPYDPVTQLGDRAFLVPDAAHRKLVWRVAANPGVVLVDGEITGVWRQRRTGEGLTFTVTGFRAVPRRELDAEADGLARFAGAASAEVRWA